MHFYLHFVCISSAAWVLSPTRHLGQTRQRSGPSHLRTHAEAAAQFMHASLCDLQVVHFCKQWTEMLMDVSSTSLHVLSRTLCVADGQLSTSRAVVVEAGRRSSQAGLLVVCSTNVAPMLSVVVCFMWRPHATWEACACAGRGTSFDAPPILDDAVAHDSAAQTNHRSCWSIVNYMRSSCSVGMLRMELQGAVATWYAAHPHAHTRIRTRMPCIMWLRHGATCYVLRERRVAFGVAGCKVSIHRRWNAEISFHERPTKTRTVSRCSPRLTTAATSTPAD